MMDAGRSGIRSGVLPIDQGLEIGFKTGTILARMLKKQFDQPPLAGTKVPMDASTGQAMQECHGLLREKFFKFFGGHNWKCRGLSAEDWSQDSSVLKPRPSVLHDSRQFLQHSSSDQRDRVRSGFIEAGVGKF